MLGVISIGQGAPVSRSWAITTKVPDFAQARDSLYADANTHQAAVMSSGHRTNAKGAASGWFRFQVRGEESIAFLSKIRGLGKVFCERSEQSAHAGEIEELKARSQRLEEHTARLRALLSSDRRMRGSDILYLQDRLMRATLDHDLLLLHMKKLEATGEAVSVNVTLFEPSMEPEAKKGGFWGQMRLHVEQGAKTLVQGVLDFAFWLVERLVYLVVLVPLFLWARRLWRGRNMGGRVRIWFTGEPDPPTSNEKV